MSSSSALSIVLVYPDLLGTYGDGGNALILLRRAQLAGIDVELLHAESSSDFPTSGDIYLLGGGEDGPQNYAKELLSRKNALATASKNGAVVFGVCAGMQILGESYTDSKGETQRGIGLVGIHSRPHKGPRAVGELLTEPLIDLGSQRLSGYENHGLGSELIEDTEPLARVIYGTGNSRESGFDGAIRGRTICTYMHGPALARNRGLADHLLSMAMGSPVSCSGDVDPFQDQLLSERIETVGKLANQVSPLQSVIRSLRKVMYGRV